MSLNNEPMIKRLLATGIIVCSLFLVVQACSSGRHLARRVLHTHDSISVCIIDPLILFRNNLKTYDIPHYDSLPENTRDSLLYVNSRYLQYVNDSLFMGLYTSNVREYLKTYGIRVYSQDSMNDFLRSGGKTYMFNLAQVSLEEYLDPFTKTLSFDTSDYRWEIWLNAVGLNVWYEASILNRNESKMQVLFANMYVRDRVKGRFEGNMFAGDINYVYSLDTISLNSVYSLASKAAKTHAQYLFDYILNDQIGQKSKPGKPVPEYMHYDAEKRKYSKAGTRRFTIMK
jgi:hypothetical protein